jgi:hypothetical protein
MKTPKISIQIGADTGRLRKDMKKADGIVGRFTSAAKIGLASAAAAAGAFAFKLGKDGVEAAIADQASQVKLATALENTTKATEAQIKANEDYITQTQMRYGVEDVLLRKSLGKLATVTGSLTKAQEMQGLALDVAAGAGISLESATTLVTKALQGSFTAFKKLGVELDANIIKNKDGAAAVAVLGKTYEGAAEKAADTTEGKLARLNQAWDEVVEGVGDALLPELEKLAAWAVSPSGAKALEEFVTNLTKLIENTVTVAGKLGEVLDNITPDPDTPLGKLLQPSMLGTLTADYLTEGGRFKNSPRTSSGFDTTRGAPINITINGAIDPASTGRQVKKILNQTNLNTVSPNAGDRRR